ncbi:MAG: DNA protein [Gammaproteobacteria bacterium]|jgi:DNA-damage-inducible protein D|nr:DNA protein [Gammaproteobacteria bacterium]
MKTEFIHILTNTFESHTQQTKEGIEFWLARDLQELLGYSKWDNFLNVVSKAKTACETSGHSTDDHIPDVGNMVNLGAGKNFRRALSPTNLRCMSN